MINVLDRLARMDSAIYLWLARIRPVGYPRLSRRISRTGDGPLYAIIGMALLLFGGAEGAAVVITALAAFAIELPAYLWLKRAVRRNRPHAAIRGVQAWLVPADEFSFPSGHTAAAFLMAFVLCDAYPALSPWAFVWAALVGASRVNLGVHFPGDVAAGAILGSACATFALVLTG